MFIMVHLNPCRCRVFFVITDENTGVPGTLREREGGIGGGRGRGVEVRDREVTVSEVRGFGGTTCLNSCSERRRERERDERGSGDMRKESRR